MLKDVHLGCYSSTVHELRSRLKDFVKNRLPCDEKLRIVAVGHGGQDTWLALAAVEAIAGDAELRGRARLEILSCSWQDDTWEPSMAHYVEQLCRNHRDDFVRFAVFKWQRDHGEIVRDAQRSFQGSNLVLQCEQGVDYFVHPGRLGLHALQAPFLQHNYEDWAMLYEGLRYVQAAEVPAEMWLVQTNSDLDMARGIGRAAVDGSVFGGQMQGADAFDVKVGGATLLSHALKLRDFRSAEQRREHLASLGADLGEAEAYGKQSEDLYRDFTRYCATHMEAPVPVASWLELLPRIVPVDQPLPEPQWLLARHLVPREVWGGQLRVYSELLRMLGDDWASSGCEQMSTALWLQKLMSLRRFSGEPLPASGAPAHAHGVVGARLQGALMRSLSQAVVLAEAILEECPGFDLWSQPDLLTRSLGRLDQRPVSDNSGTIHELMVSANFQTLDFLCRFLEMRREASIAQASGFIIRHYFVNPSRDGKEINRKVEIPKVFAALKVHLVREWQQQHRGTMPASASS